MAAVDIVIKSSRRPWALDRLLSSLNEFLVSTDPVRIYCVDDRTDDCYIEELVRRYPSVDFSLKATWGQKTLRRRTLPYVEAWKQAVSNSQAAYILVLEDDQWLCGTLNLDDCSRFMSSTGAWSMTLNLDDSELENALLFPSSEPDINYFLPAMVDRSLGKSNSFTRFYLDFITSYNFVTQKAHGLLSTLMPQSSRKHWRSVAMVNSICGTVFRKTYWSHLWEGRISRINENIMISRALRLLRIDPDPRHRLAITPKKLFETTYLSSVSLTLGKDVDWDKLNQAWSDAWLEGRLKLPEDSADWDFSTLRGIVQEVYGHAAAEAYEHWCSDFAVLHSQ